MDAEQPFQLEGNDGARYTVDILRDQRDASSPHFDVDLVRSLSGRFGESIEQRLTLAEYEDRADAETHRDQTEQLMQMEGLEGLGDAVERIQREPTLYDGRYLFLSYPPNAETNERATAQLLHLNEQELQIQPIATGSQAEIQQLIADAEQYWVERRIPLAEGEMERQPLGDDLPFTLDETLAVHDLEDRAWTSHIDSGGTIHWFAVVETEASPETLHSEPFELRYYRALPMDDSSVARDSYPVMPLPDRDPSFVWPLPSLELYLEDGNIFMAQQLAHDVADHHDLPFPSPLDLPSLDPHPEYYFGYGVSASNNPSLEAVKTWMDGTERRFDTFTIAEFPNYDVEVARQQENELEIKLEREGLEAAMNLAEQIATTAGFLDLNRDDPRVFFQDSAPVDPFTTERQRTLELDQPEAPNQLEFSVDAISANGISHLNAWKSWGPTEAEVERLIIPQPDWETALANTEAIHEMLDKGDLQVAMNRVELLGIEAGVVDPDREDPRLFTQGPPDEFETLAQRLRDEPNPYWNVGEEPMAVETPAPGTLEELVAQQADNAPEPERHYWQMHYRPVETPDGEPLGTALFVTEFPQLPPDFDAYIEEHGMDDTIYPTEARTVEMAHFANEEDARKFETAFRSYLVPDLLDGPELAPEVAKLEGLSGDWKKMDYSAISEYMSGERDIIREVEEWHLHNPSAEKEVRELRENRNADIDL